MKKETIYLAGGCFWGTEHYMKTIDGVLETKVGYALGEKPLWNPPLKETVTYEEVCNHSGHAETVEVIFDADKISLTEILKEYAYTIDPTSLGRQGMDYGIQYRTGIYSLSEEQKETAAEFLTELQKEYTRPIMIENLPLRQFIPAEEYHQDYLEKNPGGYCHINFEQIKAMNFKLTFSGMCLEWKGVGCELRVGGDWLGSDHINSNASPRTLRPSHNRVTDFLLSPGKNIAVS